nr:DNA adenine methylase [Mycoplasmopsis bovis]
MRDKKIGITQDKYIKSPLNYIGGKYKLLNQIVRYFPKNIDTFYDLFAGGCDVAINIKANKIVVNDINDSLINLYRFIYETELGKINWANPKSYCWIWTFWHIKEWL